MTESLAAWPDTTGTEPPHGAPDEAAAWLLGRHPQLARLVAQLPDMVTRDDAGRLTVELAGLAVHLHTHDTFVVLWATYEHHRPAPPPDDALEYAAWTAAGPSAPPSAQLLGGLAVDDLSALRLLGVLSSYALSEGMQPVFGVEDLRRVRGPLLADWCRAVQVV